MKKIIIYLTLTLCTLCCMGQSSVVESGMAVPATKTIIRTLGADTIIAHANIDVRRFPKGIYIVKLYTSAGITTKKLAVQ